MSARIKLIADNSLTRHYDLIGITEDVTYAFAFALTDDLSEADREKITVLSFPIKGSVDVDGQTFGKQRSKSPSKLVSPAHTVSNDLFNAFPDEVYDSRSGKSDSNSTIEYYVRAWCHSRKTATEVSYDLSCRRFCVHTKDFMFSVSSCRSILHFTLSKRIRP